MVARRYEIIFLMAICLTIGTQIPFLNIPIGLIALPLFLIIPDMSHTSPLVEYWVLGFIPQKPWVWIMFIVYYFFLSWAFAFITRPRPEERR